MSTPPVAGALRRELTDRVLSEMERQDQIWNTQHWPLLPPGVDRGKFDQAANFYKQKLADARAEAGEVSWHDILMEEIHEAFAESDYGLIVEELVQSAAVILQICEDISLRGIAE